MARALYDVEQALTNLVGPYVPEGAAQAAQATQPAIATVDDQAARDGVLPAQVQIVDGKLVETGLAAVQAPPATIPPEPPAGVPPGHAPAAAPAPQPTAWTPAAMVADMKRRLATEGGGA